MSSSYSSPTKLIAVLLVLCFLIFVIPSPQASAVAAVDDAAFILLALLAAYGITVTASGGIDDVAPWVLDRFETFVDSLSLSYNSVLNSLRSGVDAQGNFIGSPASLDYSARFALALQNQYNLTDNTSVVVSGPSGLAGFVYSAGTELALGTGYRYPCVKTNNGWSFAFLAHNAGGTSHGGNWDAVCSISNRSFEDARFSIGNGNNVGGYSEYSFQFDGQTWYVAGSSSNTTYGGYISSNPSNLPVFNDIQFFTPNVGLNTQALASVLHLYWVDPTLNSVSLNASVIDIPSDYDDDDGILVDGLGDWGDSLDDIYNHVGSLTLPDSVPADVDYSISPSTDLVDSLVSQGVLTTENSPIVFNPIPLLDGDIDLGFGNLWHYVTDWVTSFSAGIALIGGIMFSLPLVAAFYAILVILIVFSLWRLFKNA